MEQSTSNTKKDWKNIHEGFTLKLQKEWEDEGFNYEECKKWIKVGLRLRDYNFAAYLRKKGYDSGQDLNWEELRKEYSNHLRNSILTTTLNLESEQTPKINQDWKEIHPKLDEYYKKKWEEKGFDYSEAEVWVKNGLEPHDYEFAGWLKDYNCPPEHLNSDKIKNYKWQDIHQDFDWEKRKGWEKEGFDCQTTEQWIKIGFSAYNYEYAANWIKAGFDLKQAEKWIKIGFSIYGGYKEVEEWINRDFTFEQTHEWIDSGLKNKEYKIAFQLKTNGDTPQKFASKFKEKRDAQEW